MMTFRAIQFTKRQSAYPLESPSNVQHQLQVTKDYSGNKGHKFCSNSVYIVNWIMSLALPWQFGQGVPGKGPRKAPQILLVPLDCSL